MTSKFPNGTKSASNCSDRKPLLGTGLDAEKGCFVPINVINKRLTPETEWARYILGYAENQGRKLDETEVRAALRWSNPERDVALARNCALKLLNAGGLTCVWSGRPLRADILDVDHCFPWSAWPCDHLWNLLPTHKEVNQKQKRDRLPSADHLREAEKRITSWWTNGYALERKRSAYRSLLCRGRISVALARRHGSCQRRSRLSRPRSSTPTFAPRSANSGVEGKIVG
jgi:hypothetical protein